jgi:streptogramin lyase
MRKIFVKRIVYVGMITGFIGIHGCKLDAPIYPDPSTGTPVIDDVKKTHLFVSTYAKGLNTLPHPSRVCTTPDGNIYVTSYTEGKVFKLDAAGKVTVVLKDVKKPMGIKADQAGNVYVMLTGENKIVKIAPNGNVSTVKINANPNSAQDLAIANDGTLYIADTGNSRILKVDPSGTVTTLAGKIAVFGLKDGKGEEAHFSYPTNIRLAPDGFLWVIDGDGSNNYIGQTVRRVTQKGAVSTYFNQQNKAISIRDVALGKIDKDFNASAVVSLFLVYSNNTVAHFSTNGVHTMLAKTTTPGLTDGDITTAQFNSPTGISVNGTSVYITDQENNALRKIAVMQPN